MQRRRGQQQEGRPRRAGTGGSRQYTLATLVAELRRRADKGEPQDALIEWLGDLTSAMGIRMHHDEHHSAYAEDDNAAEEEAPAPAPAGEADFPPLARTAAPPRRLRPRVEPDAPFTSLARSRSGTAAGRIILSCDRRAGRAESPLCAECNGAVIDAQTWTHLVVPARAFAPRPTPRDVDRHLADGLYDIIQVSDGTVVTLYRWNHPVKGPVWCMATNNGYDVSHLRWMGELAYAEVLHDLLARNTRFVEATGMSLVMDGEGVRLNFTTLDPDRCYTVGFRHRNFHPMGADPEGVWNIQAADLGKGAPIYDQGLPHVERQVLFTARDIERLELRERSEEALATPPPVRLATLSDIMRTALEDAKATISGARPDTPMVPPQEGVHASRFNYGFILRSRDPAATGANSDILCESQLLRRVRRLVYERPPRRVSDDLDHTNRLEYSALKAFLTVTDREEFLELFPEFKPRFAAYEEFVTNVINMIIHMRRQDAMAPATKTAGDVFPRTPTASVAKTLLVHILAHERTFKVFDKDVKSIVHDFVVRPDYSLIYLRAMGRAARG